jgi:hypothetical protein
MAPDIETTIAVRQPVNPHTRVKIGPEKGLATVFVNIHPPTIHFGGLRAGRCLRLFVGTLNHRWWRPNRFRAAWLRLHWFDCLTWFRSVNHWLRRTVYLRLTVHLGLRTRRGRPHRGAAAVVSLKTAPTSVEVRTKCDHGQQCD